MCGTDLPPLKQQELASKENIKAHYRLTSIMPDTHINAFYNAFFWKPEQHILMA